jgi:hypothetical protein
MNPHRKYFELDIHFENMVYRYSSAQNIGLICKMCAMSRCNSDLDCPYEMYFSIKLEKEVK